MIFNKVYQIYSKKFGKFWEYLGTLINSLRWNIQCVSLNWLNFFLGLQRKIITYEMAYIIQRTRKSRTTSQRLPPFWLSMVFISKYFHPFVKLHFSPYLSAKIETFRNLREELVTTWKHCTQKCDSKDRKKPFDLPSHALGHVIFCWRFNSCLASPGVSLIQKLSMHLIIISKSCIQLLVYNKFWQNLWTIFHVRVLNIYDCFNKLNFTISRRPIYNSFNV